MTTVRDAPLSVSLLGNKKNRARLPLPTMRNGNFVEEKGADKEILLAVHLTTQSVASPTHFMADKMI
jgi:hypothetical protein